MNTAQVRRSLLAAAGSLVLLAGCAAAGDPATAPGEAVARGSRTEITREEIAASGATNLYDAVQRLRPQWLRGGAVTNWQGGGGGVVVYQNNTPMGGLDALRQMTPGYAARLRYLDGPTASNTLPGLGSRSVAGAIIVVTPTS